MSYAAVPCRARPARLSPSALPLLLLVALAVVAAAWGHRLPQAGDRDAALLWQDFQRAGGGDAALCGAGAPDGPGARCDACRLTDSAAPADPLLRPVRDRRTAAVPVPHPPALAAPAPPCHPAWTGRAPPAG